jgi:hypothetical protein
MRLTVTRKLGVMLEVLVFIGLLAVPAVSFGAVAWTARGAALPSEFRAGEGNRYGLIVLNVGSEESTGGPTLTDHLPAGLTMTTFESGQGVEFGEWGCSETAASVVTCTLGEALPAGRYSPPLEIEVSAPTESPTPLDNTVSVTEGGATVAAVATESTPVGTTAQAFKITDFSMEAHNVDGTPASQAGGHPWEVTASLGFPWVFAPPNPSNNHYRQVQNVKRIGVELPAGMFGNLLSTTEHCTQTQLGFRACPPGSRVGSLALTAGAFETAVFRSSSENEPSPVFNMVPEPGYPAQLGFTYAQQPIYLDATVLHTAGGERVRLTSPGIPPVIETGNVVITLWGEPGAINGSGSEGSLITDPANCSEAPLKARVEAESWGGQGHPVSAETIVFPQMTGCGTLQAPFTPGLELTPLVGEEGTTQADSPSGFEGVGTVPQTTSFNENTVAQVRDVSVTLPPGLSVSPAAAQGLVGCEERGANGINLGTRNVGAGGVDLGNPEATELGAGHAGGNGSSYDDGVYHTAPGHCPQGSIVGSVEVFTPLLATRCGAEGQAPCQAGESPAPLQGHVFIAQPKCGGAAQAACTGADAEDGVLFSGYVELSGDGVLIKEHANIAVNQANGQMTLKLRELPEFPFNELKFHVEGGPRAPLATPQTCGPAATNSVFTPWSSDETFSPQPSSFTVDANAAGGACPSTWPFAPGFTGGSLSKAAGGFTSFTTTLTRQDREQNVTGLAVKPPLGLLAMLSSVTPCPEPQAAAGECPESSLIGHDTAGAGAGPAPLYVTGRVYLTGPYKGAPFGLDVVTPAAGGPFNLGNIVVRATINVNPSTAQVTIASDPIPQFRLGVPLRLKALNVTIDREHFALNPTNCSQLQYTATATGNEGAIAGLSVPFAVTGCAGLKFKPRFTVSTGAKASKASGASLHVKVTSAGGPQPGGGEANIAKVKVNLPLQLPSRLSTLQKACVDSVFDANPGSCPAASVVGQATAVTPVLAHPLTGPAYLVSHAGAAFPDLEIVLQGEGITLMLDGNTQIKKGITSSIFRAVPDAPISSFDLVLPEGPHSVLATNLPAKAKQNLCGQTLNMPTVITGQNGAVVRQTTKIAITGCPKQKTKGKSKKH